MTARTYERFIRYSPFVVLAAAAVVGFGHLVRWW